MKQLRRFLLFVVISISVAGASYVNPGIANAKALKNATFSYLNVGQGNSELIQVGNSDTLIDTGRGWEYDELEKQLALNKVTKINTLILSHPDADHMENADKLIRDYHVKEIVLPQITASTQCYLRMDAAIKKYKVKKIHPKPGTTISLGKNCKAKVLSVDASQTDTNEASIVLRATYGKRSFLYMGDATERVEDNILSSGETIASDVFLCSHHGSDTANSTSFVKKALTATNKFAVISVGKNSYGHPVANIVKRLTTYSKQLYRTDKNGMITFTTNGNKLSVSCKKIGSTGGTSSSKTTSSSNKNKSTVKDTTSGSVVYITATGKKYHIKGCSYLRSSSRKISKKEAKSKGYTPCSRCCG